MERDVTKDRQNPAEPFAAYGFALNTPERLPHPHNRKSSVPSENGNAAQIVPPISFQDGKFPTAAAFSILLRALGRQKASPLWEN